MPAKASGALARYVPLAGQGRKHGSRSLQVNGSIKLPKNLPYMGKLKFFCTFSSFLVVGALKTRRSPPFPRIADNAVFLTQRHLLSCGFDILAFLLRTEGTWLVHFQLRAFMPPWFSFSVACRIHTLFRFRAVCARSRCRGSSGSNVLHL